MVAVSLDLFLGKIQGNLTINSLLCSRSYVLINFEQSLSLSKPVEIKSSSLRESLLAKGLVFLRFAARA